MRFNRDNDAVIQITVAVVFVHSLGERVHYTIQL